MVSNRLTNPRIIAQRRGRRIPHFLVEGGLGVWRPGRPKNGFCRPNVGHSDLCPSGVGDGKKMCRFSKKSAWEKHFAAFAAAIVTRNEGHFRLPLESPGPHNHSTRQKENDHRPDTGSFHVFRLLAAYVRSSDALIKASKAHTDIRLEPPILIKGKVTPVRGRISVAPKMLRQA